jgi:bifunctional non-homologous end joining protein LigD
MIHRFRNDSICASLNHLLRWSSRVAFQRRKPAAMGVKAPLPGFIEPALASSIAKVPSGARWAHEIKFDGYRVQVHLANGAIRIFTRRGHDWTHRFKKVAHDAWHIKAASAVIDGEIVVPAADGTTDFSVLQNELKGSSKTIVLVALRSALPERPGHPEGAAGPAGRPN